MPYYHVRIAKKSGKHWAFAFDLSKKQVMEQIIIPFTSWQPFMCGDSPIQPSDVDYIRINETEESASQISRRTRWLRVAEGLFSRYSETEWEGYSAERHVTHAGRDVTKEFIKGINLSKEQSRTFATKESVFIVHGRDEEPALQLQKFLKNKLGIEARMFEDFKEESSSNTIIEQLEYVRDTVAYAFIVVTPDDLGCLREEIEKCRATTLVGKTNVAVKTVIEILGKLNTRARQNVVFEHGLFIGALGRDRVCCLRQRDTKEKPTDIDGILYVDFDKTVRDTFPEITEKLRKLDLIKK